MLDANRQQRSASDGSLCHGLWISCSEMHVCACTLCPHLGVPTGHPPWHCPALVAQAAASVPICKSRSVTLTRSVLAMQTRLRHSSPSVASPTRDLIDDLMSEVVTQHMAPAPQEAVLPPGASSALLERISANLSPRRVSP